MNATRLTRARHTLVAAMTVSVLACIPALGAEPSSSQGSGVAPQQTLANGVLLAQSNTNPATSAGASASASTTTEPTTRLEEVTVTARKEVEPIESVPLTIQVFNPAELARGGQAGLVDIAQLTPGFVFQTYADSFTSSPTIRGLAQFDVTSSVANVTTVVDGVYLPRNYSVDLGIVDISRVEIDKGPQSALYGSNAFAGVIGYTLAPPPKSAEADARVTAGNAGRLDYKFAVGDSLFDDVFAYRINYARTEYDGTWKNYFPANAEGKTYPVGAYHNDTYGATVRIKPVSRLEVDLDYFHLDRHENLRPDFNITTPPNATNFFSYFFGDPNAHYNCVPFVCGTLTYNPAAYESGHAAGIVQPFQPGFTSETDFYSARATYDITDELKVHYTYGWVSSWATSVTSSSDNPVTGPESALAPGTYGLDSSDKEGGVNEIASHELRFEWNHGPWKAIAGGYYSDTTDLYQFFGGSFTPGTALYGDPSNPLDFTGFSGLLGQLLQTKATSGFARLSYDFLDGAANVAGEFRHEQDKQTSIATSTGGPITGTPASELSVRPSTFSYTTPRFTASYKLAPQNLLYASAAEGEKQGGFNPPTDNGIPLLASQQVFQPEKNWTYELGSKNTFFDGRAIVNADVFYIKWTDLQNKEEPTIPAGTEVTSFPAVITLNEGGASSKGFESDGRFAVTQNLTLQYAFAYVDATFDAGDIGGELLTLCTGQCPVNASIGGNQLPRYSKIQATGAATWKQPINADLSWTAHGEVTYQSQQEVDEANLAQIPARTLVNLNAGITGDRWDLTIWGRNVFNRKYVADSFFEPLAFGGIVGYSASLGELATYGVTFNVHYH